MERPTDRSDRPQTRSDRPPARSDRPQGRPQPGRGEGPDGGRRPFPKKKVCRFCKHRDITMDYKDVKALRPFLTDKGRIVPRRISGACAKHQREICAAIKMARALAIAPFASAAL